MPAVVRQLASMTNARGPDPRANNVQWYCAHAACVLIEDFGLDKPAGTGDGNVHSVTQLIYEAVTGEPQSGASCLGAAKSALTWRKSVADLNRSRK